MCGNLLHISRYPERLHVTTYSEAGHMKKQAENLVLLLGFPLVSTTLLALFTVILAVGWPLAAVGLVVRRLRGVIAASPAPARQ